MSEQGEGAPTKKGPFKFLRRGEGKQVSSQSAKRKEPTAPKMSAQQSPFLHLPDFQPTTSPLTHPLTGRSTDSGVPQEDVTRPPTGASLPMDRPSSHERPAVVEEHDEHDEDEGHGDEITEELEHISARQGATFMPESASSSPVELTSEPSENALKFRRDARMYREQANKINGMASVSSFSPHSYVSSELSAPIGASTPINPLPSSFRPPTHQIIDTPQARPLSSNRVNVQQNVAQTGVSLIQNGQQPRHQLRRRQKENVQTTEHIYDQPVRRPQENAEQYFRRLRNLEIQLRDTIAHLDLADVHLQDTKERLVEQFKELARRINDEKENYLKEAEEQYEKRKNELEEDFKSKFETIQEDSRAERERNQRDRREIERDRKMLQKESGEKMQELIKTKEELRKKLENSETNNAKLRQEVRLKEEKLKKKTEEWEKVTKDYERSKKTCATMEKRIRQMRNEKEKEQKEMEMFAQAERNRNKAYLNQTVGALPSQPSPQLPRTQSLGTMSSRMMAPRGRSVSWADEPELEPVDEYSLSDEGQMQLVQRTKDASVYRDESGEETKVSTTMENGRIFEFSNGDQRFVNAHETFKWYHHVSNGCIEMDIVAFNIKFVMYLNRQLEIHRPGNNVTLISVNRLEVRTELINQGDDYHVVEIFDRDGKKVQKDTRGARFYKKYASGEKTSFRDGQSRFVAITKFDDFELIEPEFRLRWFEGNTIVMKVFGRERTNEKTLRIEADPRNGGGQIEAVESRLHNGVARKTSILKWKGPRVL